MGAPLARLELEVTESVLLTSDDNNIQTLHELHEMGVSIALDDFGTGYSSLSYLTAFPLDKIKIDKSFIDGVLNAERSRHIVRTAIDLAHTLGMTTVGEGIEDEATAQALLDDGHEVVCLVRPDATGLPPPSDAPPGIQWAPGTKEWIDALREAQMRHFDVNFERLRYVLALHHKLKHTIIVAASASTPAAMQIACARARPMP